MLGAPDWDSLATAAVVLLGLGAVTYALAGWRFARLLAAA
jgi:hypothetical protein